MVSTKMYYDVVLVQPNITWVYDSFEHLGLAYLASSLRAEGFSVLIVDAVLHKYSMSDLYKELDRYQIGILGVTLISHGYLATERFLKFYKSRHIQTSIIAGGHFATFAAEKIFKHTDVFDAIALGEAEHSFIKYCDAVLKDSFIDVADIATPALPDPKSNARVLSMDSLPFPARDNLNLAMAQGAKPGITASRGCYARCAFCTVHNFYRRKPGPPWIGRSVENVIAELQELYDKFGIREFIFVDDNFMSGGNKGRQRAIDFAEAYKKSKLPMTFHIDCRANDIYEEVIESLYEAGLRSIFVGIESVSQRDLKNYRKGLKAQKNWEAVKITKKYNLNATFSMIMFNPETDCASIIDNIEFLEWAEYFPRNPLSILNIYEGTDLKKTYEQFLKGPFWDYTFDFKHKVTAVIYKEAMRFCKDTLPLERELSQRIGGGIDERFKLSHIRLLFLKDLTQNIAMSGIEEIRSRWQQEVSDLRHGVDASAPLSIDTSHFGSERLYMTGSPLDKKTKTIPIVDVSINNAMSD